MASESAASIPAAVPASASPDDFRAVCALLAAADLPADDLTPAHLTHFLTLHDGRTIVGVVGLERHGADGLLRSLAVGPAYRGRGYGVALVEAIEAYARDVGVDTLYLLTTTAEAFFARRGYERVDRSAVPPGIRRTAEFDRLCPATAACMKRTLRPATD